MIVTDGSSTVATTFGVRDEKGSPYLVTTPNRVASVSKPITATAVLTLVQAGKLGLDDSVLDVLNKDREKPIVPKQETMRSITVRQLLQHHGGFGSDSFLYDHLRQATTHGFKLPIPAANLVELAFTTQTLATNPGTSFRYSNAGYLILGRVIEKVSGKTYEDYVQTAVLAPAGISKDEAFIAHGKKLRENETRYWDLMGRTGFSLYPEDNRSRVPFPNGAYAPEVMDAHGGWAMSAQALIKFQLALPKLIKPEMQRLVTAPPPTARGKTNYTGLGFTVIAEQGGFTIQHGGDLEGCNAAIMYRANGQIIAVVSNTGGPPNDNGWSFNYINDTLCPILNQMAQN
jgi:CubicO group peptidase (beta-lactamase class C family)